MGNVKTWIAAALTLLLPLLTARPVAALLAFDEPKAIASNAATDSDAEPPPFETPLGLDRDPQVASDGSGTWVVAWTSADPAVVLSAQPGGLDVVFTRSTDDGLTWSPVALLDANAADRGGLMGSLQYRNGTWIAAWTSYTCTTARSTDGGATWIPQATTDPSFCFSPQVEGDGQGHWVLIGSGQNETNNYPAQTSFSLDDGVTWSPLTFLPDELDYPEQDDDRPRIVTDGNGTWLSVWGHVGLVVSSLSTDNGGSWTVPVAIPGIGEHYGGEFDVATDGSGHWMAVGLGYAPVGGDDLFSVVSSDPGTGWSVPVSIGGAAAPLRFTLLARPQLVEFDGTWQVIWEQWTDGLGRSIGEDGDLVGSRSFDLGTTWSDPAAVNPNAGIDTTPDYGLDLAHAENGTAILAWVSTNTLDGTIGTDEDILYSRSHDDCPTVPLDGCRQSLRSGGPKLSIGNALGGADKLSWKWKAGEETLPADFGDPTTVTGYALCIYGEAGGSVRSIFETDARAAEDCPDGPCWAASGAGYRYADPSEGRGSVRSLTLRPGPDGKASVTVRAAGPTLAPPVMPIDLSSSVRVQLVNTESQACWEATFSSAPVNEPTRFRASAD